MDDRRYDVSIAEASSKAFLLTSDNPIELNDLQMPPMREYISIIPRYNSSSNDTEKDTRLMLKRRQNP